MYEWLAAFSSYVRAHAVMFGFYAMSILVAEAAWALVGNLPGLKISEARKEQLKLRATMFNNLAVAMFTIGVLSPLVAALYNLLNAPKYDQIVNLAGGWLGAGIAFHLFGALSPKRNSMTDQVENFAAYGAPAILIILGYALLWWTRLSPRLAARLGRLWEGLHLGQASHKRN